MHDLGLQAAADSEQPANHRRGWSRSDPDRHHGHAPGHRQGLERRLGRARIAHTADDRLVTALLLLASQIQ